MNLYIVLPKPITQKALNICLDHLIEPSTNHTDYWQIQENKDNILAARDIKRAHTPIFVIANYHSTYNIGSNK